MNHPNHARSRWPAAIALGAAVLISGTACSGNPLAFNWDDTPDTVLLYSLARPELNLVSAFNFLQGTTIRVESATATGSWDAAIDTDDGEIVILAPGAFGVAGAARIATLEGLPYDDVTRAPRDTLLFIGDRSVPVRMGNVYVIKTNRSIGAFGRSCVYYAKLEPIVIDASGGTLTFRYVTNPVCNSPDLVPPN